MGTTAHASPAHHPHVSCHLGLHEWSKVRDDDQRTHYVCQRCHAAKASNEPWWEFASEAGTGFH
jgi:hypothetical protein